MNKILKLMIVMALLKLLTVLPIPILLTILVTAIIELFIKMPMFAFSAVDLATSIQVSTDPYQEFNWTQTDRTKTIKATMAQHCRAIELHLVGNIDTSATQPGRSADSPYDMISRIVITGGQTKITYDSDTIRAVFESFEQQAVPREDKPTVTASQTNDEFGFTVTLPAPIPKGAKAEVKITFANDASLDVSAGSEYSNFDGTGFILFLHSDEVPIPMVSYEDEDSGAGTLAIEFPSNIKLYFMMLTNEIGTIAAPAAGADAVKYENSLLNIKVITSSGNQQLDDIPTFDILSFWSSFRNDVAKRTGFYTLRPNDPILLGANNKILMETDGTSTRGRGWILGSPPIKDTK